MNTGQIKFHWEPIAAVACLVGGMAFIVADSFATFFPWLALLSAIILLVGGIAFAAWPPMSERLAQLRRRPHLSVQHRIYVAVPIVLFGVTLLALSQSQIRSSWRAADVLAAVAEVRAEVTREIEDAKTALQLEQVDEALKICNLLDSKTNADEKTQVAAVRAHAQTIQNANRVKAANRKVRQLLSEGIRQAAYLKIDEAQSALDTAMQTPFATEFQNASELADAIAAGRAKLMKHVNAKRAKAANDTVRQLLTDCHLHTIRLQFDEAQSTLDAAVQTPFATEFHNASELADAIVAGRAKVEKQVMAKRVKAANATVRRLLSECRQHVIRLDFDEAQSALLAAAQTPDATDYQNASELGDAIVAGRTELAQKCLDAGDVVVAKQHAKKAVLVSFAKETAGASEIITDISNREVEALVDSARKSLANMNRDEAAATLENALAITDATQTDEAKKLLGEIREALAVAKYTIVEREDISMKALTKRLSSYTLREIEELPTKVRMKYRILVPSDISAEQLKATMIQLVIDETAKNPDIDQIAVFAYDRKQDVNGVYTFGKLEWCPNGDWAGVTPAIARNNDRTNYTYSVDIKGKVGDPTSRPTKREYRIYDALYKAVWADPDTPEEEIKKKIAEQFKITVKQLDRLVVNVLSYQTK